MAQVIEGPLKAGSWRFAIVASRYNSLIADRLLNGAIEGLKHHGATDENITVYRVPGSYELAMAARKVAGYRKYAAIICVGALIRGETLHFELISRECARGIQQVAADFGIPVTFGVITADTTEQAMGRAGERSENKGWEAALAAIEMANLYQEMSR